MSQEGEIDEILNILNEKYHKCSICEMFYDHALTQDMLMNYHPRVFTIKNRCFVCHLSRTTYKDIQSGQITEEFLSPSYAPNQNIIFERDKDKQRLIPIRKQNG